ncbi:Dpp4p, partial [Linderina pennispora]
AFKPEDVIIARVTWLTDKHDKLMVHAFNRVQDHQRVYLANADPKQLTAKMVRERSTSKKQGGDDAWIEISSAPLYVPANTVEGVGSDGYIEIVENGEYTHLALFSSLDAAQPARWLTSGDWDVISGTAVLDRKGASVYYASTQQASTKSTIYKVSLNAKNAAGSAPQLVSPPDIKSTSEFLNAPGAREGTYDASFSTSGGFFQLNYKGPQIPWQAVYSSHDAKFERILTDNADAHSELEKYDLPTVDFFEVPNEVGDKMNAMALYPPGFDKSAKNKYGVLFRVYGGPNSQQVSRAFSLDWHAALVSQQDVPDMPFIVAVVDGRGTAHKGRKFRSAVSKHLGEFEPDDQAAAAKYFQGLPYINPHRMAIWGWSYGGYTTTRAIERHSDVFKVGMAVAPVTDWRFYDSVYTERYMKTPQMNLSGYKKAAVTDAHAFANAKFLVQHGTGDDNVHMQHTLALVDLLESKNIPGFEMAFYADSDHGIYTHGVRASLYARMTNFLFRSFHELENEQFDYWYHDAQPDASNK